MGTENTQGSLENASPKQSGNHMDEVRVTVAMELGRADATLDELLQYTQNTVFDLDRVVGDPVDLRVNGRLFGRGEVVTVGEHFGVRVTEVVGEEQEGQR